jgi:hypothetical protein
MLEAYLQHKAGPAGPFQTESVPVKESPLDWQVRGLQQTASGYGERLATPYMVRVAGRWRRVYCYLISNSGTLFIGRSLRAGTIVQID